MTSPNVNPFSTPEQKSAIIQTGFNLSLEIAETLAELLGLDNIEPIFTRVKNEPYPDCRFVIWSILRAKGYTFQCIGQIHKYDHTSIIHGVRQCKDRCDTESTYKAIYDQLLKIYK